MGDVSFDLADSFLIVVKSGGEVGNNKIEEVIECELKNETISNRIYFTFHFSGKTMLF